MKLNNLKYFLVVYYVLDINLTCWVPNSANQVTEICLAPELVHFQIVIEFMSKN